MSSPFRDLGLAAPLCDVLDELGFAAPTEVQARCLAPLLEGRDLIGRSATGSGKTAAFLLPVLHRMTLSPRRVQALVLGPTRELCAQVAREARTLGRRLPGLQVLVVAGGQPARPQVDALARGVHVVVGTPGRVADLLGRGSLRTDSIRTLVLDEADRMLEMGFEREVEQVLAALPRARQTALFSATFPATIEAMSRRFQRDPVRVTVEVDEARPPDIRQFVLTVEPASKGAALARVLRGAPHRAAIVFCNLKATAAELEDTLRRDGFEAAALHGDLEQFDRDRVLAKFRNGSATVLVATDVAARGLDVEDVDLVVNYDLPQQPEVYVHRVGRTGRAGRAGSAVTLASPRDASRLDALSAAFGLVLEPFSLDATPASAPTPDTPAPTASPKRVTLMISGGRKDKVRKGDVLGALTGEAGGLAASDVGTIELHDTFTYVAVSAEVADTALRGLRDGRIKGRKFRVSRVD